MTLARTSLCNSVALLLLSLTGCGAVTPAPQNLSAGVAIAQEKMADLHQELSAQIKSAAAKGMAEPGLAGATGGVHVKLLQTGEQEILIPLPQLTDAQVPLSYYLRSEPAAAVTEYRLRTREDTNDVVAIRLKGNRNQEVQIEWSAVVLLAGEPVTPNDTAPETYRAASGSAQAEAAPIKKLSQELWPANGKSDDYAAGIQKFIGQMKQRQPPRSLDAAGILESGASGICTANANLAAALLRAKGIAARSIAVIPTNSQRLEMHRIVEFAEEPAEPKQWRVFDPSSLHLDLPMKPCQSVIMAKTTPADEKLAMQPRMGAMVGCPYGQELELLTGGITLSGQDFFWTLAKPLAEFPIDDETAQLAAMAWKKYLETGKLSEGQIAAQNATSSQELRERIKPE